MAFGAVVLLFACIIEPNVVYGDEPELTNLDQCPYNDFCTRNRTNIDELPSGYKPCCPTCYCDTMCFQFRDCCPDVDVTSRPVIETVLPVCLPPFHNTTYTNDNVFTVDEQGFFQKRSCPDAYVSTSTDPDRETINRKCLGRGRLENLDEYLLVSNRNQPTEVFGNKYCAACNGVNDTIQWNLKVRDCSHTVTLVYDRPAFDLLAEYLLDNCYLESIPPDDLQSLERIKCWLNQPYENTCDLHSQWASRGQGERIKEACEQSTYEQVFVDYDADLDETTIYASYKCYLCENGPDQTATDVCTEDLVPYNFNMTNINNTMVVMLAGSEMLAPWYPRTDDAYASMWGPSPDFCSNIELYDKYTDRCFPITCPGHTALVDKQCIPIGQSVYGVETVLQIRFFIRSSRSTNMRSDTMFDTITRNQLTSSLGLTQFVIIEEKYTKFFDQLFENITCIAVEYFLFTSFERPVEHAVEHVRELVDREIEWNITTDEFEYRLSGRVTFLDVYEFDTNRMEYSPGHLWYNTPFPLYGGLYVCQHVVFKATEYCSLLQSLFATSCSSDVFNFKIDSKLVEGFYVLTPDSFGICTATLKKYLAEMASKINATSQSINDTIYSNNDTANSDLFSSASMFYRCGGILTWPTLVIISLVWFQYMI